MPLRSHRPRRAGRLFAGLLFGGVLALAAGVALALPASGPKLTFRTVRVPSSATFKGSHTPVLEDGFQLALSPDSPTFEFSDYETGVWAINRSHPGRAPVPLTRAGKTLAEYNVAGIAYSPNGHYLYVGMYAGGLMIFRVAANPAEDRYVGAVADPHSLLDYEEQIAVAPSGKVLYLAQSTGLAVIDLTRGGSRVVVKKVVSVPALGQLSSVAVSPNGKVVYVAAYSSSGVAALADHNGTYTEKGLIAGTEGPLDDFLYGLGLSPDGRTLYLAYYDYLNDVSANEILTAALTPNGTSASVVATGESAADSEYFGLTVAALGRRVYGLLFTATSKGPPSGSEKLVEADVPGAVHKVSVSGKAVRGQRLTAKVKALTGTVLSYQWLAGAKPIRGASRKSLKVSAALAGKRVSVRVSGSVAGYSQAPVTSRAVAVKS